MNVKIGVLFSYQNSMPGCVIYTRVSTIYQVRDGISLELQEKKGKQLAEFNEWEVKGIFTDKGLSGRYRNKRVGLQNALDTLGSGDVLIIYSLSRLSRSVHDTLNIIAELADKEAELVSITEKIDTSSAGGKMMFRMLLVLTEFESDITAERVKASMDEKRARGEFVGRPPYGWALNGPKGSNLAAVSDEQANIMRIRSLRNPLDDSPGLSYQKIADKLNSEGILCRGSMRWYPTTIRRILMRGRVPTKGRKQRKENEDEIELPKLVVPEKVALPKVIPKSRPTRKIRSNST